MFESPIKEEATQIMWKKISHIPISITNRAQVPVVDDSYNDVFRIYYSDRTPDNKSQTFFVDVLKEDPTKVVYQSSNPILALGKRGSFDWAGIMPTEVIQKDGLRYLYYIGWSKRTDVPYHNSLGLAVSEDGKTFSKISTGPIFSTSRLEPGFVGTISVIKTITDEFMGYYLSCQDWVKSDVGYEPIYDIKLAVSTNGIDWTPTGQSCISLEGNEGGISQACVRKLKNGNLEMHFSSRGKVDYRRNIANSYRIRRALSRDGKTWERSSRVCVDVSSEGWDSEMAAYPYIISYKNLDYLFYNGNGFGATGIGFAIRDREIG